MPRVCNRPVIQAVLVNPASLGATRDHGAERAVPMCINTFLLSGIILESPHQRPYNRSLL